MIRNLPELSECNSYCEIFCFVEWCWTG